MIERHRELFRALPDEALDHVAAYFGVGDAIMVREALEDMGLDLCDVAWALCSAPGPLRRAGLDALGARYDKREVERPWPRPLPAAAPPSTARAWRGTVAWVDRAHRWLPSAAPRPGHGRLVRVRRGVAVTELLAAGVAPDVVREAVRAGRLRVG